MKKYAVIVAGGKGVRMGSAVPKQFLPLNGQPILYHTLKAFIDASADMHLVLVLQSFPDRIDITIVAGGETRYHSVQNGLKVVETDSVVFVHDGVRPLVTPALIQRCYEQAVEKGSAIPAIAVADSMRIIEDEDSRPIDREQMRIIQTPQTFRSEIILPAFKQEHQPSFTDEATVVEAYGDVVFLTNGERSNIKVTTPEDMIVAEALLKVRNHA